MARHYLKIDEWETWIPESERDDENPITMEIRFLTKRQNDHYTRLVSKARNAKALESDMRELFAEYVRNVTEYSTHDPETGRHIVIRTGVELFDHGDERIKIEVTEALFHRKALDDGLAKKLQPPSAVSAKTPATQQGGGVQNATAQSNPDNSEMATPRIQSSGLTTTRNEPPEIATDKAPISITPQPLTGDVREAS